MSTQKAIVVESPKAPFTLSTREVQSPGKGEVLIKTISVALNPANWIQREYNILIDAYPVVLGNDVAGIVEEVGEGVEGFSKGDRVFGRAMKGGFQEYTIVAVPGFLLHIPKDKNFDEVATIPMAFTSACIGLFAASPIGLGLNPTYSWDKSQQGESALVIGGGTSVGQFAIQLLKSIGFLRIVAYASKKHFEYLGQLGVTECIDRSDVPLDSLATALKEPVKVVYHTIDLAALNTAYDCVCHSGAIVSCQPTAPMDRDVEAKNITFIRLAPNPAIMQLFKTAEQVMIQNLSEMLNKGIIKGNRYEVLPNGISGILEGLERLQKGDVHGVKLVAHPHDLRN
ncbi:GroES-like protein [Mycena sanguinolenta]|uniref:GroES-like protein n=1 Tax=Mycena sanguinolenta TaxID=230812 RepID=A0A8H6YCW5_9AGAR|nr:GroES-like protein [Mycena sanguinolenta]